MIFLRVYSEKQSGRDNQERIRGISVLILEDDLTRLQCLTDLEELL